MPQLYLEYSVPTGE